MSDALWIYVIGDLNEGFEALGPYDDYDACMDDNMGWPGCAMLLQKPPDMEEFKNDKENDDKYDD